MATVEILFKAIDQTSKTASSVSASLGKIDRAGDKLRGTLANMGKSINGVTQGLTGMDLTTLASTGTIIAAINQARKAVTQWSAYADQMWKVSEATGVTAEDTSRLVQAADDLRISQDTITAAMEMAVQNGFVPTIDNLAKLADEYNATNDPAEKTNLLQKVFTKQWKEVVPLMKMGGDRLREVTAATADGMIVTEASIAQNQRYQESLDNLSDSWTILQNTFAKWALPGITAQVDIINEDLELLRKGADVFAILAYNQSRYIELEARIAGETEYANDFLREGMRAQEGLSSAIDNTNPELAVFERHMADAAAHARNMAQTSTDLATAIEGLQATQSEWKEGAGGDIASMLDENTIGSQRYEEALAAIDRVNGTNLLSAEKLNDAQAELVKQYQNGTMSIDEFEQGLTDINDAFMPLDESIKNSTELIQGLIEKMESFGGTVYTAVARVVIENALEGSTGGGNSNGVTPTNNLPTGLTDYTNYGNNSGGATPARNGLNDFVVPPGYSEPNKPYFIATSSNEHVTVTPAGQSSSSGNSNTVNIYPGAIIVNGASDPTETAQEVYRQFSKMIQDKSRSGAALAGRT